MGNAYTLHSSRSGRVCHESVVIGDKMFLWGGETCSPGVYHSRLKLFSVNMISGEWDNHTANIPYTPTPCRSACSAVVGTTIYSFGGMISRSPLRLSNEFYKLFIEEMRWRRVEVQGTKPMKRGAAAMCCVNGKLLMNGGYGVISSHKEHRQAKYHENIEREGYGWNNELWSFDVETNYWSPMYVTGFKPSPRESHTLTPVDEERVVLFGGYDGHKELNDLWLLDVEKKIWTHITPSASLWPQARSHHTVCAMCCKDEEIKVLMMGGYAGGSVMKDCWMMDVMRGSSEKITFDGKEFGRWGHSVGCVTLTDGTVAISAFGGSSLFPLTSRSIVSRPCFYQWNPHHPSVLHVGRPAAGAVALPRVSASSSLAGGTSQETRQLMKQVQSSTKRNAQLESQLDDSEREKDECNVQLTVERSRTDKARGLCKENNDKQICLHNERQMSRIIEEKGEMEQRIEELEELLRNAEAANEDAERRLREYEEVLNIPAQDIQLSCQELGSGSLGTVCVGYWHGCPVAVKVLHENLAKKHYRRQLLEKEVCVASRLHHPNIAAVCGVTHQLDASFCLVMELLQSSLSDIIDAAHVSGSYLTLREQTDLAHDCLSGLTYLHNLPHPILHGDIHPTNILITSVMKAKLGDIRAACFTVDSLLVGPMSPLYVAPERLADRTLPNSQQADVYSMGVSLGELFTGDQVTHEGRMRQLQSVNQRDLRLVCVQMAHEDGSNRMKASVALKVSDRVVRSEGYTRCGPRRVVKGVMDGVAKVTLCEKPW